MTKSEKRNKYCFGLGTIGRDMFYSMESMYLLFFLTEIRNLDDSMLALVGGVLTVLRVLDAFNDPITGVIIDNTHTRWGKFKPWMLIGAVVSSVCMLLMFADLPVSGGAYVAIFAVSYILWDIFYGVNDIAYWTQLPALSLDPRQRESMGAFARICANVGLYAVVVGILPVTGALTDAFGGNGRKAWFVMAIAVCVLMVGFQLITIFGVKEAAAFKEEENTSLRDMVKVLFGNDQLMWTTLSMALFMIGYCTTTSFGTYYFKYAYGDEGMYSVFAGVLGVSQLAALMVFPRLSAKLSRRRLYSAATALVAAGYVVFFFAPMNMIPIALAGVLLFVGQAFIQALMLMFLADTVEYGQWKLGKRNDSITFSIQPLINKLGAAVATGVVTLTLIVSGINQAQSAAEVTSQGLLIMKVAMMVMPLLAIALGYFVYLKKYNIDEESYRKIVADLKKRGDIK
ncbi:MAG: glycoside-pentoside-hexuronide (GPH):cation symporter [Oscillospiraceae bacterium]|nr:glycoside-pentoside-hexuronide (GPH):cation symporter [Oscillospiraceae bacterium]